jgi:PBP1b-binding outer membrane lipoprotein LpoB
MDKKTLSLIALVLMVSGCTTTSATNTVSTSGSFESSADVFNLSLMVSDNMEIKRTSIFSGEMTKLVLRLYNLAEVNFNNVHVKLINADDLNPEADQEYVDEIKPNNTEVFQWDLTAPTLGIGEVLVLNDITVRTYYDTYSTSSKAILLKEYGDRDYLYTYSESSKSPIKLSFDTSYESLTTAEEGEVKDFTVNMILYNEYTGLVDYYDNTNITDNYIRSVIVGIPKELIFYNYEDENSPWIEITNETVNSTGLCEEHSVDPDTLATYNYYYIDFKDILSYSSAYHFDDLCHLMSMTEEQLGELNIDDLREQITEQRRVLWMTKGFTKINVLKLGAYSVESDTEVIITGRVDYSYSQDFGGDNFGLIVYGTG